MKIEWLLMRRFFWNKEALSTRSTLFALLGLSLGVAVLYVALSVLSGFEKTLKNSLIDVGGHLKLVKRSGHQEPWQELFAQVQALDQKVLFGTPFLTLEGVTATQGVVQGILIQGLDEKTYSKVLKIEDRLVQGTLDLTKKDRLFGAVIGTELASRIGKTVGDNITLVVPRFGELETTGYRRSMGQFQIRGILDMGKYDWNERLVVIELSEAQRLAEVKNRYAGLMLKISDADAAENMAVELITKLGPPHWVRDWKSEHENTFAAVQIERRIIFFVVFIIIIVAAFSLVSNLLLQSMQKISELSVLKSFGMRSRQVIRLFFIQGLALGLAGVSLGLILGWLISVGLTFYQARFGLIAGSVYQISNIDLSVRAWDLLAIIISTLLISVLSGAIPALRAARLLPSEGLKND